MTLVNIDSVGQIGVIRDDRDYRLDPSAWSDVLNVRTVDGEIESIGGRQQVFGTLTQPPQFSMWVPTGVEDFWLWTSLTDAFVYDGTDHTEITRVSGDYSAQSAADWNGVIFGGLPIINNGSDIPQLWSSLSVATVLDDLPNWPSTLRAKVVRALPGFLVAFNVTKSSVNYPHRVKWSHVADPGTVPSSWDETDPTKDAGETDLPDVTAGVIVDALNLRGQMFIYKQGSIWRMRYIGGSQIFAFDTYLDSAGLLAPRSVALTGDGMRHFVVTQDDVIVHDGNSAPQSIFSKRARRYLFSQIDPANYGQSFAFSNPTYKEVWFCFPTLGNTNPDRALIWNYETGTISETEVDFVSAANGPIVLSDSESWDTDTGTWASDNEPWSQVQRQKVLVTNPTTSKLLQLDSGSTFDGSVVTTRLQRLGLALIGRARDGKPIVDFNRRKQITRVWPRLTGGPVNIRLASQDSIDGPTRWTDLVSFDPGVSKSVDLVTEGATVGIEFSSAADVQWRLEGYKLDLQVLGEY